MSAQYLLSVKPNKNALEEIYFFFCQVKSTAVPCFILAIFFSYHFQFKLVWAFYYSDCEAKSYIMLI